VKVNKLSLKQDGGPSHQMPDGTTMPGATHGESMGQPQQQVDPAIQQITEFISTSINNGDDPIDVVMTLVDQQVDEQTIAEVFMQVGYAQEDVVALFEQVQQKMQPPGPASPEQQTQDPQEIARNEAMAEQSQMQQAKSGIEIKPENEGKFTAWAKARGMSVQEAASKVMSNKDQYPPSVVKMANFAKNAAGWNKKQEGGEKTPQMIEYLKALEFNKEARQAIGTNDLEKLKLLSLRKPYNNNDLARDFSELQRLRKDAGLGLIEDASITFPHVGQQIRGGLNHMFGTNFEEGGEFKPHFMYKGERKIRAKDMETHLRLKEAGYGHDAPKAQRGLETDKLGNKFIDGVVQANDAWTAGAPNYVNPIAFESGNNFSFSDGLQVLGKGITGLFGNGDENEDGLKDGFFRNLKEKNKLRELKKGDYYKYDVKVDDKDPNTYGFDNLDLYNASIGQGGLRDLQTFTDDVNENSRVNFNPKTGKYDSIISSRSLDEDVFGNKNAFSGENLNYFNNVDDDTRQQLIDYGNASANGMPAGTTLSIDPVTGAVGYVDAGVNNPNQYDTMMGYNAYGRGNAKQQAKSMISDGTPAMTNERSIMEVDNKEVNNPLSFKEWSIQNAPTRLTGSEDEAQQKYQNYLKGFQKGGATPADEERVYGPADNAEYSKMIANVFDNIQNRPSPNYNGLFNEDVYEPKNLDSIKPIADKERVYGPSIYDPGGAEYMNSIRNVFNNREDVYGPTDSPEYFEMIRKTFANRDKKLLSEQEKDQWWMFDPTKRKMGGSLPKAQIGVPNDMFGLQSFTDDQFTDQQDYFSNMFSGQTNYMQDTADVADAQLQKENPGLGATPLEQSNQAMFQTQQNLDLDKYRYDQPTVTRTNKIQGDIGRFMDSKGMQAYTGASDFAVQGARVVNNFFDDRAIEDAQADNRNNMIADNIYATNENPMLKRGTWDVNTGTFGSEGQRTVQEGGEMATVDSLLLAKLIAAGADIEIL